MKVLIVILLIINSIDCSSIECQSQELYYPCECVIQSNGNRIIRCFGDDKIDLINVFNSLNDFLTQNQRHFHMFYLNNSKITELIDGQFGDVTFDYILIDSCSSLSKIEPSAFNQSKNRIKSIRIYNTPKLSLNELNAFNSIEYVNGCPSHHIAHPCECETHKFEWQSIESSTFTRITCFGHQLNGYGSSNNHTEQQMAVYQLKRLQMTFYKLSIELQTQQFDEFLLSQSKITELPRHLFGQIKFTSIIIDDTPIHTVNSMAFFPHQNHIKQLTLRKVQLSNDRWHKRDYFAAFTSLTNLIDLELHWSGMTSLPHHAFRPINGQFQRKLQRISIKYRSNGQQMALQQIGSFAFYYLPSLKSIDLSINYIHKIHQNAFAFRWPSNDSIEINLAGNNLSDDSFEFNSFSGCQRPTQLIFSFGPSLGNPRLKHFDERIFMSFLMENKENKIVFYNKLPDGSTSSMFYSDLNSAHSMSCDCQSKWLFNAHIFKWKIDNFICDSTEKWQCLPECLVFPRDGRVHCGSQNDFDLKKQFNQIQNQLNQSNYSFEFKSFELTNHMLSSIPSNSFGQIKFEHLNFAGNLNPDIKIDENAFESTQNSIKKITLKLANAKSIQTQLPWQRFSQLNFVDLINAHHVTITQSMIGSPPDSNLNYQNSNQELIIRLNRDILLDDHLISSFEFDLPSQRPIKLYFDSSNDMFDPFNCPPIKLHHSKFRSFLLSNEFNSITVMWCPLVCDCTIKWLYDSPSSWQQRVSSGQSSIQCHDKRNLNLYSSNDFIGCHSDDVIPADGNTETTENPMKIIRKNNFMFQSTFKRTTQNEDVTELTTV